MRTGNSTLPITEANGNSSHGESICRHPSDCRKTKLKKAHLGKGNCPEDKGGEDPMCSTALGVFSAPFWRNMWLTSPGVLVRKIASYIIKKTNNNKHW